MLYVSFLTSQHLLVPSRNTTFYLKRHTESLQQDSELLHMSPTLNHPNLILWVTTQRSQGGLEQDPLGHWELRCCIVTTTDQRSTNKPASGPHGQCSPRSWTCEAHWRNNTAFTFPWFLQLKWTLHLLLICPPLLKCGLGDASWGSDVHIAPLKGFYYQNEQRKRYLGDYQEYPFSLSQLEGVSRN